jgi:hypothetical protein
MSGSGAQGEREDALTPGVRSTLLSQRERESGALHRWLSAGQLTTGMKR